MKFISWNIDSLNAALTSDSARAQMSRQVLETMKKMMPMLSPFKKPNYQLKAQPRNIVTSWQKNSQITIMSGSVLKSQRVKDTLER